MFCAECGAKNEGTARFCTSCGAKISAASGDASIATPSITKATEARPHYTSVDETTYKGRVVKKMADGTWMIDGVWSRFERLHLATEYIDGEASEQSSSNVAANGVMDASRVTPPSAGPNKLIFSVVALLIFALITYTQITIFVVPPIGAVPEGRTLIIMRHNKMKFIDSADGMCERIQGGVSIFCRLMMLGLVTKEATIILRLPYSAWLYSISTGGITYER